MRLLKTKKKKTWHSVCHGDYDYQSKDTYYIVELTEEEYQVMHNTIHLSVGEQRRLMKLLEKPAEPNEALIKLMQNSEIKTDAGPCIVKYVNGQPDLSEFVDAGPCIVKFDENGNPIVKTSPTIKENK